MFLSFFFFLQLNGDHEKTTFVETSKKVSNLFECKYYRFHGYSYPLIMTALPIATVMVSFFFKGGGG